MKKIFSNKWVKFAIAEICYILWVIWLDNYWWMPGAIIVFDLYISKKVPWAFWKKITPRNKFQKKALEWVDALIFAVIAASFIRMFFFEAYTIPTSSMEKELLVGDFLFVSKFHYGPKMPNTPLAFPFVHNTMPGSTTTKSFVDWIKWDYRRIAGLEEIKNDDIVVFNFPEGDTVALEQASQSYYQIVREYSFNMVRNQQSFDDYEQIWKIALQPENLKTARTMVNKFYTVTDRPIDKCDNYIKRCVAIPGDTLEIIAGDVYINGKKQKTLENKQYMYQVATDGSQINKRILDDMHISNEDRPEYNNGEFYLPLTKQNEEKLKSYPFIRYVEKSEMHKGQWEPRIFPHNEKYRWNLDFFGPLILPKRGMKMQLTIDNLPLYEQAITHYEKNTVKVEGNNIFINDTLATSYTFTMNYYWMMGDNRHNSLDSRYWGFVPENHIVGKPVLIWLSLDKDKSFPANIRWKRLFNLVDKN